MATRYFCDLCGVNVAKTLELHKIKLHINEYNDSIKWSRRDLPSSIDKEVCMTCYISIMEFVCCKPVKGK